MKPTNPSWSRAEFNFFAAFFLHRNIFASYEFNIFPLLLALGFFFRSCLSYVPLLDLTLNTAGSVVRSNSNFSIYKGVIVHCFCQLIFNFHSDSISTPRSVHLNCDFCAVLVIESDEGVDCVSICRGPQPRAIPKWADSGAASAGFVCAASDSRS